MANKLDQLFREHLDQHEMKPSAAGWGKVKEQLDKKKWWILPLRVAAAILVVTVATFTVMDFSGKKNHQVVASADVNHPVEDTYMHWELDLPLKPYEPEKTQKLRMVAEAKDNPKAKVETAPAKTEAIPVLQLAALSDAKLETNLAVNDLNAADVATPVTVEKQEEQTIIKITYIASSDRVKNEAVTEQAPGKLNKVISLAKEVSSTDILADIREAKDNLFRRNN